MNAKDARVWVYPKEDTGMGVSVWVVWYSYPEEREVLQSVHRTKEGAVEACRRYTVALEGRGEYYVYEETLEE